MEALRLYVHLGARLRVPPADGLDEKVRTARQLGSLWALYLNGEQIESVAYAFYLRSVGGSCVEANRFGRRGLCLAGGVLAFAAPGGKWCRPVPRPLVWGGRAPAAAWQLGQQRQDCLEFRCRAAMPGGRASNGTETGSALGFPFPEPLPLRILASNMDVFGQYP
ncbi:hypothetical protein ACWC0C_44500 [Streptomyces sp. NPDC001709]